MNILPKRTKPPFATAFIAILSLFGTLAVSFAQSNATLSGLVSSTGPLSPAFTSDNEIYTATAPPGSDTVTVTPTATEAGATITVNGIAVPSGTPSGPISLNFGNNVISTVVVSADTTATKTYTLTVARNGPIRVVNTGTFNLNSVSGNTFTVFSGYPVTDVDKLVVTISGEHGFPNGLGLITNVTFAGQPLTPAIKLENGQTAYREGVVGIYYMDNPSQFGESGDVVFTNNGNWNSFAASAMSLVGTAPGVGNTSFSQTIIPSTSSSVSVNTSTEFNIVIAATVNGVGNTATQPTAAPPQTSVLSWRKTPANFWCAGGSGYQFIQGLASATPTFTYASTNAVSNIAASFGVAVPTLAWDLDGAIPGAGGAGAPSGNWDALSPNWNPSFEGTGSGFPWINGRMATFAAGSDATGSYTVTLDSTRDITGLNFEEGEVTISGNSALRLSGFSVLNAAAGISATVVPPLSQDATGRRLTKAGPGRVALVGNSSYTGDTTVAPGGGTLVLSGTNSAATGGMNLNGGVTRFESPASINGTARNVTVNAGGAVEFGPAFGAANIPGAMANRIATTSTGAIAADNYPTTDFTFSTPGLTAASLGAVGVVDYTGILTPNGTTYRLGGGGGTLNMVNANAISGAGSSLVISGNVSPQNANNFAGGTTLNTGNLAIGNNAGLGTGPLTVNGGSISSTGMDDRSLPNNLVLAATTSLGDPANFGKLTFTGTTQLGTANRVINLNSDAEFAGAVTGTGFGFTKNGAGVLTLSGPNTYTGTTTVNSGFLILNGSNNSTGATTINNGGIWLGGEINGGLATGTLTFGALLETVIQPTGGDRTISNNVTLTYNASAGGTGAVSGGHNLTINGNFTFASGGGGNRTLNSSIDAGKALTLAGQVRLTDNATARNQTITGTGVTRITGPVVNGGAGAGSLTKNGTGTVILSNTSTYTGTTTVSGGTLAVSGAGTVNTTSSITVNGATAAFMQNSSAPNTRNFTLTRGTLGGTGTLTGLIIANASVTIAPGDRTLESPARGTLTVNNGVTLLPGAAVAMRLFSPASNDSDKLVQNTTGTLTFDGTLDVTFATSFTPVAGSSYDLFDWIDSPTGTFAAINLPELPEGLAWQDFGGGVRFDYSTGQIRIVSNTTFASWLAANAPATGFTTDSDNDGVPNGVEHVLGTNPNTPSAGLNQVTATPNSVTFRHQLNPALASDVSYTYQWSTDLTEWKTSGQSNTGGVQTAISASAPDANGIVTVTMTITAGSSTRLSGRLVATQ